MNAEAAELAEKCIFQELVLCELCVLCVQCRNQY
jgi:hypothetical protein